MFSHAIFVSTGSCTQYFYFIFFLFVIPPVRLSPFTYSVTAAILFYAVSHLHESTSRKLRKICAAIQSAVSQSLSPVYSLWKNDLRSAFRYAGRGQAATHLSTDTAPSCLTWSDHLVPDTNHTLNAVGTHYRYFKHVSHLQIQKI